MTTAATVPEAPAPPVGDAGAQASTPVEPTAPRLEYATPWPKHRLAPSARAQRLFWRAVRKTVLAGGLGLLVYGLASVAGGVNKHVAPVAAAWGIAFVVMMLPAPYLSRRRSRRRPDVGHAIACRSAPANPATDSKPAGTVGTQ